MGLSSARNKGIDSSYGEYILFVNGDDVVSQDFCSVLWNNLLTADSDISIVNKKDIDESFRFERKDLNIRINNKVQSKSDFIVFDNKQALGQLYGKLHFRMVQVTGVLYKKELFDDIRFPFGKCHEDEFVSYKLLAKAKQIVYEDSQIYYRRIRPNNIISGGYSISNLDILEACRQRKEFFVEKGWSDLYTYAEYDYLKIIMDAFCLIDNDTQTLRYTINYIKKQLYLEWKNEFNLHKNDIKKIISFKQCIMLKIFRCNPVFYKKLYMTNQ